MESCMVKFVKCSGICSDLVDWFKSQNDIVIDRMEENEHFLYIWYHIKEDNE